MCFDHFLVELFSVVRRVKNIWNFQIVTFRWNSYNYYAENGDISIYVCVLCCLLHFWFENLWIFSKILLSRNFRWLLTVFMLVVAKKPFTKWTQWPLNGNLIFGWLLGHTKTLQQWLLRLNLKCNAFKSSWKFSMQPIKWAKSLTVLNSS